MQKTSLAATLTLLLGLPSAVVQAEDLLTLYQQAVQTAPLLKTAEYTVELAKAQERQALGALLPQVGANGSYSLNQQTPPDRRVDIGTDRRRITPPTQYYEGHRAQISLRQVLFDVPAYFNKLRYGEQTLQSQQDLILAQDNLLYEMVSRYFKALAANDKINIITSELEANSKNLARVKEMFNRQMAKITDVYHLDAHQQELLTDEIDVRNEYAIALESIRELTGTTVHNLTPLIDDSPSPPLEKKVEEWLEQMHGINPALQSTQHAIEAADYAVHKQYAEHLPSLSMSLSQVYTDLGYNNINYGGLNDFRYVSVDVNIPIYEGGVTSAAANEAVQRLEIARQKHEETLRELERKVRSAYVNAKAGLARIDSTELQVTAAEKTYAAMQKGYTLNANTIIEVLDAQKDLSKARMEALSAKYGYLISRVGLFHSVGVLDDQAVEDINHWLNKNNATAPVKEVGKQG